MRRRKVKGAKEKLMAYEAVVFEAELLADNFLDQLGWRGEDIWVEVGMGRGQFIIEYAKRHPEKCFIGIEMKEEVLLRALQKLEEESITNLRFILGSAHLMPTFFSENSLEQLFINFCDPWPKKRWEKRRLSHNNYLEMYHKLLKVGGEVHFKTDSEDLFEFSLKEFLNNDNYKLKEVQLNLHKNNLEIPTTEYEDKFRNNGLKIYRLVAENLFDK